MVVKNTNYTKSEINRILEAGNTQIMTKSQEKLLEISSKIYLFDEIDRDSIIRMTKNVTFKQFKRGQILMKEGDDGEEIYFILSGGAAVIIPALNNKVVAKIDSGQMLGEMAFITKKKRSATIIASKDETTVIMFQIDEDKCSEMFSYPFTKLYKNIALDLTRKLEASNKKS